MHDILPFMANFALKSSQTGRNKDRVNTLKDTCDPSKFHICECKTSFFFYLGFTASQDYFTHFEPSQSLGLRWGKNRI